MDFYVHLFEVNFVGKDGKIQRFFTDYKKEVCEMIKSDKTNFLYLFYKGVCLGVSGFLNMFEDYVDFK